MAYTHSSAVCQCIKMADANEKLLAELLKKPGNNMCADCGARSEWVFRKVLNKLVYYTTKGNANNTINYLVNYFSDHISNFVFVSSFTFKYIKQFNIICNKVGIKLKMLLIITNDIILIWCHFIKIHRKNRFSYRQYFETLLLLF